MGIIYNDTEPNTSRFPVKYDQLNATKHYLTHLGNYYYLRFIHDNTQDRVEKHQANKEIAICERKLAYWMRHPNFDRQQMEQGKLILQKNWNIKP